MIEAAKQNLEAIGHSEDCLEGKTFLADNGYHCEENLRICEEEKLDAYIPDTNFRKRDERFAAQKNHNPKKTIDSPSLISITMKRRTRMSAPAEENLN